MGGAKLRGLLFAIVYCAVSILPLSIPSEAQAAPSPLEFARDFINLDIPIYPGVVHDISFVLPTGSTQVSPEDWIEIIMPNYTNITMPSDIIGAYGSPTYSLIGKRIKISNIAILPGTNVNIGGITAANPNDTFSWEITIRVVGTVNNTEIIRNESTIIPTTSNNVVNVSASIETPLSAVDISGYTSPNTFVMLTEDTVALGTTTSDGSGFFRFSLNAMDPDDHVFTITSTDSEKRTTSAHMVSLFMLPSTAYSVTGIILSPTIGISTETIKPGDTVTLSGQAKPLSAISIVMQPVVRTYNTTTDAEGNWSYTITGPDTTTLTPGVYQLRSQAESDGILSLFSPTVNLNVQAPDDNNPPPCGDISKGDLNCDTKTNLRDFSILLTHWNTNHRRADIIADGIVNLKDFSRMMFYFQR